MREKKKNQSDVARVTKQKEPKHLPEPSVRKKIKSETNLHYPLSNI